MQSPEEIKHNLKELYKRYYEVKKDLKHFGKFDLGSGDEKDIENTKLVFLWINIRNEIFYNRVKLVKAYETIS